MGSEILKILGGLVGAAGDALAGAFVDHKDHDVRQRRALLLLQGRVQQRHHKHGSGQPAQPPARQPAPHAQGEVRHAAGQPDAAMAERRTAGDGVSPMTSPDAAGDWPTAGSSDELENT